MTVTEMKHQARKAEWKDKILECRSSGKSVKEWCGENHVSDATYYRWEREIFGTMKRRDSEALAVVEPPFAELPAPSPQELQVVAPSPSEAPALMASIRLEKGELNIYAGADPEVVKMLCRALKLC